MIRLVVLLCMGTFALLAQNSSGTITGGVRDPQDASVANASVTITNTATNTVRKFSTNETGEYVVPLLQPGPYSIAVKAPGFKNVNRSGITLQVGDRLEINFKLEMGALSEQVTVESSAALVNTQTNTLGQVIENRRIVDLPLNGREPFSLAALSPGVLPAPNTSLVHQGGSIPSINGASNFTSEVTIDGMPNTTPRNNGRNSFLIFTPSVDAVEEFRVQTNSMSAEYGRFNGGVISVVTKSGTNELHGTAYEFLRNSFFDANSFFNNRAGIKLGALRRNQFGGAIGGPVVLPKVYNGRNKTFFFFDYEAFREAALSASSFTVPTALERQGDFSRTLNSASQLVTIYDPATTRANPSGAGFIRDAFPGNVIPLNRISPIAQKILGYYPLPSNTRLTGNLDASGARIDNNDTFDMRLDHYVGASHRIFGRLSYQQPYVGEVNYFGNVGNPTNPPLLQKRRAGTIQDVWTLSPTTILNLSYGISRMYGTRTAWSDGFDVTQLGLPATFAAAQQVRAIPLVTIGGYTGIGNSGQNYSTQLNHTFLATVTRIKGPHTIKGGFDYRSYYINQLQNTRAEGNLTFGSNFTQGPNANQASSAAGNGFATFLVGVPTGSLAVEPAVASRSSYLAGFVQDDWKLTRRLTLNLGLRYEVNRPRTERYNRISAFDVNAASPLAGQVAGYPNLKGALSFRNSDDRALGSTDWNNWAPRVGFAYQVLANTSVRGGYGIFYGLSPTDASGPSGGFTDGFTGVTSIVSSLNGVTPIVSLSNPFPNGFVPPLNASQLNAGSLLGSSLNSAILSMVTPYFQQWNFSLQQGIGSSWVAEIAYAGSKGTHTQQGTIQLNSLTAGQMALGAANQELVANPFYGIITDSTSILSQPTVQRGQLSKPFPQYTGVAAPNPSIGNSNFHSMQLRVEKRFSKGFTTLAAYTISKNINDTAQDAVGQGTSIQDPFNLRAERSLDPQDVSQRLVLSGVWELPFGKGKHFGNRWAKPVDLVLGGWQLNGIGSFQTGYPLAMTSIGAARPNRVAQGVEVGGAVQGRLNRYFDTTAFAVPAAFTYGNSSRTAPDLRSPGMSNWDLSLFKMFPINERVRTQFRLETFNAFNRVQFGAPGTQAGSTSFGVITSQVNNPRQLQLALKILF